MVAAPRRAPCRERIIADVRADGDEALRRYGEAFDRVAVDTFRVADAEIDAAVANAPQSLASWICSWCSN